MVIRLLVSGLGNIFMRELAEYLRNALTSEGHTAELVVDGTPVLSAEIVNVIVAPHEYCLLDPLFGQRDQSELLARCVLVSTEQPGTSWFETSAAYCAKAGLVFDINEEGVSALRERGVEAHYWPLGYQPTLDRWGGVDRQRRDIDVLFMGDLNRRRSDLLAQYARLLVGYRVRLVPSDSSAPVREETNHFVLRQAKADILCRTRVLLDLHRGAPPYFSWHRAIPALTNGAVVMTEPSAGLAPLRAFEHLVVASYDLIPYYLQGLLGDEARRSTIAREAYALLTSALTPGETLKCIAARLQSFAEQNARAHSVFAPRPTPAGPLRPPYGLGEPNESTGRGLATGVECRRGSRIVAPELAAASTVADVLASTLKTLLLTARRGERRAEETRLRQAGRYRERLEITPAWSAGRGDVSVVVSVHNYRWFVEPCLESVLASTDVHPEVIVIDDASTDESPQRTRAFMEAHPEFPLAHVVFPTNRGLSAARNRGFETARSEFVFVLDVDNLLYPTALVRLHEALLASDSGFAYGAIEAFGDRRGLLSVYPWDVAHLVQGNYIDAMSMIRRTTWQRVGGYVEGADADALYGWEDFDFWLSCAELGISGLFVPEILARYRTHANSMLTVTNLETGSLRALLPARHPSLDWGRP